MNKEISLLGTRGIPAKHGGFETFVQRLAPYLNETGWKVRVYCQQEGGGNIYETKYGGVILVNVPVQGTGTWSTIKFDWLCWLHALRHQGLYLSFGYPTAVFFILPYVLGRRHIINMDGIEWKRSQFGLHGKIWYYLNERIAAMLGDKLIADHPEIRSHLETRCKQEKLVTIAYGADQVYFTDKTALSHFSVETNNFGIVIARPEKDNSILEIVQAFSEKKRNFKLIVLGNFHSRNTYHQEVMNAASEEVVFPGAIYDQVIVQSLRTFARFYVHGHRVGGTNPSLVESLAAGNAILAHDNKFNRWVAADAALYFRDTFDLSQQIDKLITDDVLQKELSSNSTKQYSNRFKWETILEKYNSVLSECLNVK